MIHTFETTCSQRQSLRNGISSFMNKTGCLLRVTTYLLCKCVMYLTSLYVLMVFIN